MANIKRILQGNVVFFLAILLLLMNFSFAQKAHAFLGAQLVIPSEVHVPKKLPKLMKELAENFPFEIAYLSNAMDISFVLINGSARMSYYEANAVVHLEDDARIEKASWYMIKRMNSMEADFRVNGSCVTHHAIANFLGGLTLISLPSNPFNFTNPRDRSDFIYGTKLEHGMMTISLAEKNLCLTRFEFHSQPNTRELKKLEEADMRTPEEIQKKPDQKP